MTILTLPGGRATAAGLVRTVRLVEASGSLELALADAALQPQPWPAFTSRLLALACTDADGTPWREADAAALCLGDRQFLLLRMAAALWGDTAWLSADCVGCGARFDLPLDRRSVPVQPAGAGYPWVTLAPAPDGSSLRLRLPDATDEQAAVQAEAGSAAAAAGAALDGNRSDRADVVALLQRCLLSVDGRPPEGDEAACWTDAMLAAIDAAMDAVAPAVADTLLTNCPECGLAQPMRFELLPLAGPDGDTLLDQIHRLATHYHWSEADIVALPRARRLHYLQRVDSARGWSA